MIGDTAARIFHATFFRLSLLKGEGRVRVPLA
jgi:hypothetical protein